MNVRGRGLLFMMNTGIIFVCYHIAIQWRLNNTVNGHIVHKMVCQKMKLINIYFSLQPLSIPFQAS